MERNISIKIIDNRNNRLEVLKPLLEFLAKKNLAKNDNGLFIVRSALVSRPVTEAEELFKVLQEFSNRGGYHYNCYNLRDDQK